MKLSTRLSLIVLMVSIIIFGINAISLSEQTSQQQYNSQKLLATTVIQSMIESAHQRVVLGQSDKLSHMLQLVKEYEGSPIEYMYVTSMNGQIFAHSFQRGIPKFLYDNIENHSFSDSYSDAIRLVAKYDVAGRGLVYEYESDLVIGLEGQIHIGLNQSEIKAASDLVRRNFLIIASLLSALCTLIAWALTYRVTRPLKQLTSALTDFRQAGVVKFPTIEQADPEVFLLSTALQSVFEARDKAEKEIRTREKNLNVTLNSIGDAVIATDKVGKVTRMNPTAERLTGWAVDEAKGVPVETIFKIVDEETRELIDNPVNKVLATGETVYLSNHTTLLSKDGCEYQIAESAAPIVGADKEVMGMVLAFNDISKEYALREQLRDSLERFRINWQGSPIGMIEWTVDFKFVEVNPTAEVIFGFSKSELVGKGISSTILADGTGGEVYDTWDALVSDAGGRRCQFKNKTKDGRVILCEWYNTTLVNKAGDIIGVTSLVMDITEQNRLETVEKENKNHLEMLMNGMLTMVVTMLPDGTLTFVSKPTLEMIGLSSEQMLGKKFQLSPWINYVDRGKITDECNRVAAGETISHELEMQTVLGKKWIDYSLHPVYDSHGKVNLLVAEGRDATKRRQAEEQLHRGQKMDALSQIVGGIAHDYNNMLGVIVGYTDLLKKKYSGNNDAEKFLDRIIHAAKRGEKLTRKMLNFSRPESGHAESLEINKTLEGFQDVLSKSLTSVVQLEYQLSEANWSVWSDFGELEDSVLNIAINAKYAMPNGGRLIIRTENIQLNIEDARFLNLAPNDYVKLSIIDTGVGIEKAVSKKIFEPFFSTKGKLGNGLGLSQVFGFMQRTGGTVNVHSEVGAGSQFNLYFPRYKALKPNPDGQLAISSSDQYLGHQKILVVDDEPALKDLAREILSAAGYRIITADDGLDALDKLAHNEVDLIFSDVIMPNMGGYQLAGRVAKLYPEIKIQLTTGFSGLSDEGLEDRSLKSRSLKKPYSNNELLKCVYLALNNQV